MAAVSSAQEQRLDSTIKRSLFHCPNNTGLCADVSRGIDLGFYSGHDEPAIVFYSSKSGSGNSLSTTLTIPVDPPTAPRQDGTGGTFNFQLHPAFWFGMVLCDNQSSPNSTPVCTPDSDANIFENPNPAAPDFIGHHPGGAILELQFYPPGGLNPCSHPKLWCAAMTIDSFSAQDLTGKLNNADCRRIVGDEPVNFAFLTATGVSQDSADPLNTGSSRKFNVIPGTTFLMKPGDTVQVSIHDSPAGLVAAVHDLTSGATGSMTASVANGFAQVLFAPDPNPQNPSITCSSRRIAFHPMFATSSERTRAVWTSHAMNVSFADEIGHHELCNGVKTEGGNCTKPGVTDPKGLDFDDVHGGCFSAAFLASLGLRPIGACIGGDFDFDSADYFLKWPGTGSPATDAALKPTPIRFTDPRFRPQGFVGDVESGGLEDFGRIAFETNLPGNEFISNPACDLATGVGCTNPPKGAAFYPIYSMTQSKGQCVWQLGGGSIPGTVNNFGGNAAAAYGSLLPVNYILQRSAQDPKGGSFVLFADYRRVLSKDPCDTDGDPGDTD
ncbi:MAG TPA: hypothetical protein VKZ53_22425 [Candidatus Angelobacter sp.]|nr:hypothetical protein [Candidatus Angelobacter sp.]